MINLTVFPEAFDPMPRCSSVTYTRYAPSSRLAWGQIPLDKTINLFMSGS